MIGAVLALTQIVFRILEPVQALWRRSSIVSAHSVAASSDITTEGVGEIINTQTSPEIVSLDQSIENGNRLDDAMTNAGQASAAARMEAQSRAQAKSVLTHPPTIAPTMVSAGPTVMSYQQPDNWPAAPVIDPCENFGPGPWREMVAARVASLPALLGFGSCNGFGQQQQNNNFFQGYSTGGNFAQQGFTQNNYGNGMGFGGGPMGQNNICPPGGGGYGLGGMSTAPQYAAQTMVLPGSRPLSVAPIPVSQSGGRTLAASTAQTAVPVTTGGATSVAPTTAGTQATGGGRSIAATFGRNEQSAFAKSQHTNGRKIRQEVEGMDRSTKTSKRTPTRSTSIIAAHKCGKPSGFDDNVPPKAGSKGRSVTPTPRGTRPQTPVTSPPQSFVSNAATSYAQTHKSSVPPAKSTAQTHNTIRYSTPPQGTSPIGSISHFAPMSPQGPQFQPPPRNGCQSPPMTMGLGMGQSPAMGGMMHPSMMAMRQPMGGPPMGGPPMGGPPMGGPPMGGPMGGSMMNMPPQMAQWMCCTNFDEGYEQYPIRLPLRNP